VVVVGAAVVVVPRGAFVVVVGVTVVVDARVGFVVVVGDLVVVVVVVAFVVVLAGTVVVVATGADTDTSGDPRSGARSANTRPTATATTTTSRYVRCVDPVSLSRGTIGHATHRHGAGVAWPP
jgi:hypothetical protein